MARKKSSFKGLAILAGAGLIGAYFEKPIMAQVHKFIPSLKPAK
jgi:hypothetical protein